MINSRKIAKLEEQLKVRAENLKKLNIRIRDLARQQKTADLKQARKTEAHRQFLLGAYLSAEIEKYESARAFHQPRLDDFLVRDADRKVFELQPRVFVEVEKIKKVAKSISNAWMAKQKTS